MTDFLTELEHELLAAAQRRSARSRGVGVLCNRGVMLIADLRAIGSGAMMSASVGVVAVVLAVVVASGIHRSTAPGSPSSGQAQLATSKDSGCGSTGAVGGRGWTAVTSRPGSGLSALLRAGHRANTRERRAALRAFDQTSSGAQSVYVRDIRIARLSHGMQVTLLGVQSCLTVGWAPGPRPSAPRSSVVAEIRSVDGVATILLGSVEQIRSGAAFRARTVLLKSSSGVESVAMVPSGVVRIVCHGRARSGAVQRFPVVDHLAVLPATAAESNCNLGYPA